MTIAVEINHLKKVYHRRRGLREIFRRTADQTVAVDDISLSVKEGEFLGLLGHNGAGKTTIIKILSTLILPTDGTARIYGHDIVRDKSEIKRLIGLIHSDERSFFWRLTGRQNLEFFTTIFGLQGKTAKRRISDLLDFVGLEHEADKTFHSYSTGMKQKLAIARGLLTNPKILFMDEAMRSLDPVSSHKIRNFIKNDIPKLTGGTVIIATNRLDEASELCDRIAVLRQGHLVACGTVDELKALYYDVVDYELELKNMGEETYQRICRMNWIKACDKTAHSNKTVRIRLSMAREHEDKLHHVLREIIEKHAYVHKCTRKPASLEMLYNKIHLTPASSLLRDKSPC